MNNRLFLNIDKDVTFFLYMYCVRVDISVLTQL